MFFVMIENAAAGCSKTLHVKPGCLIFVCGSGIGRGTRVLATATIKPTALPYKQRAKELVKTSIGDAALQGFEAALHAPYAESHD